MAVALIRPTPLPETVLSEAMYFGAPAFDCRGIANPWSSFLQELLYYRTASSLRYDHSQVWMSDNFDIEGVSIGKPKGLATFLKSDVDAANENMQWKTPGRTLHQILEWLNWTLGATCGVGLAYTDSNPHIRLYTLPQSKMRGAIGWMYGPPLGRERTMQLSQSITTDYYFLRLIQHEFGHFLGHYGSGSHSGSREDIMYPSLQHIKATRPRYGKSVSDVKWEVNQFGEPWITLTA
jgi:hypothetical protein